MNFLLIMVLTFIGQQSMMRVNMGSYPTFEVCTGNITKKEAELQTTFQRDNRMSPLTITSLCLEEDDGKTEIPK